MSSFVFKPNHGVMIPIPQYPLYTASLAMLGGIPVPYHLKETENWGLDFDELESQIQKAKKEGTDVIGIVVINPGNPTGQCLQEEDLIKLVKFASKHNLVIMADEVYQENIYNPKLKFTSIRKVVYDLKADDVHLINFHSTSKGLIGECGLRGGYFELVNFSKETFAQLYKVFSISLCPNTVGQVATELMVNPPKEGDASY
eukprot:UN27954